MPSDPHAGRTRPLHGPARAKSGDPLRDGFFELLVRSYRIGAERGKGLELYRACAATAYRLCGERWAQHTIFPTEAELVRRFLRETGLAVRDVDAAVQLSLMANPWAVAWTEILQKLDRAQFSAMCTVSGAEILRSTLAAGRGAVCAHYHTLFEPLFWNWLEYEGIPAGVLIREWVKTEPAGAARDVGARAFAGARELKAAVDALRAGSLAQIVADGYEGKRKVAMPFCNRSRGFETTFIDLALMSGAPILTVAARFEPDGSVRIEIGPPLPDDPGAGNANRTKALLQAFLEHMRRQWQEHPADISWFQMKRHLGLPPLA